MLLDADYSTGSTPKEWDSLFLGFSHGVHRGSKEAKGGTKDHTQKWTSELTRKGWRLEARECEPQKTFASASPAPLYCPLCIPVNLTLNSRRHNEGHLYPDLVVLRNTAAWGIGIVCILNPPTFKALFQKYMRSTVPQQRPNRTGLDPETSLRKEQRWGNNRALSLSPEA